MAELPRIVDADRSCPRCGRKTEGPVVRNCALAGQVISDAEWGRALALLEDA